MNMVHFGMAELSALIAKRKRKAALGSYTSMLLKKGEKYITTKLLEEVVEAIVESKYHNRAKLIEELGDVFYVALVLAAFHDVDLKEIEACLAKRHGKRFALFAGTDERIVLGRLQPFTIKNPPLTIKEIINASGFELSEATEIVLIGTNPTSHPARQDTGLGALPVETKELKTRFQERDVKVKVAVPSGEYEDDTDRMLIGCLTPIVCVAKKAALPTCIQIIADYVKALRERPLKALGCQRKGAKRYKIRLCIIGDTKKKERWFLIKGNLDKIYKRLRSIQPDIT
jgi:phosphoribosyl-ATP pyrophosphohydrolase